MEIPRPEELLELVRSLPAAEPLLNLDDLAGVHLVGGAVRDLLMGGRPVDLDLVVEGDAAAVAGALGGDLRVHDRFGTSTVRLDGFTYDFAQARRERYPEPGALPEVAPASLEQDLLRRDFTVNAIAIALKTGELHTSPNAQEDLQGRVLRVLHDQSFIDDPTRLLRLARYKSRLGFDVEPRTEKLVQEAIDGRALSAVSGSRVGMELRLLSREADPIAAFATLRELGLDEAIHPGFGLRDPELARRALELLPTDGRTDRLVIAAAARDNTDHDLLDSLAFEAADRDAIVATASSAHELAQRFERATRPSQIADAVAGAPLELVALAGALGPSDQAAQWITDLRHVRLEIDGRDLMAAGVPEGPAVGRGLRAALAAKLDGQADGREAELAYALQAAQAPR